MEVPETLQRNFHDQGLTFPRFDEQRGYAAFAA